MHSSRAPTAATILFLGCLLPVRISTDGGANWTNLVRVSGQSTNYSAWAPLASINLNAYLGQLNVKLQFRLTTNASTTAFGVALDDVKVVKE